MSVIKNNLSFKIAFIYCFILFFCFNYQAAAQQVIWYQNENNINLKIDNVTQGTYTENEINPSITGINNNAVVAKYVRDNTSSATSLIRFDLPNKITNLKGLKIRFQGYIDNLTATNSSVRLYLRNSSLGSNSILFEAQKFSIANEWETFEFDFSNHLFLDDVVAKGGFDQIMIGFAAGAGAGSGNTYYVDNISADLDINVKSAAHKLSGSWGLWYQVRGAKELDDIVADGEDNYLEGADEIIEKLPTLGHVFTSLTWSAHGNFFNLRGNNYIDIANEIHPDFVPSLENEQIIIDVIQKFKSAGKKVILYYNLYGPRGRDNEDSETTVAWDNYYLNSPLYTGTDDEKEAQAYRLLSRGFFERCLNDFGVDGFWFDAAARLPGGDKEAFSTMVREIDKNAILFFNVSIESPELDFTHYFHDENGNDIEVDTDNCGDTRGLDEESADGTDNRDYKVVTFEVGDPWSDGTGGHITPLQQGAPPNSWAYEELTHTSMSANAFSTYNGEKIGLRHAFHPVRARWTSPRTELRFEVEQAYRFVRRLTDAGAGITWSTTTPNYGPISDDEMVILEEIDRRMSMVVKPPYTPYTRPAGAYFVGEDVCSAPTALSANVTALTATLNWSSNFCTPQYTLSYREIGNPTWTSFASDTNRYVLTGLLPGSNYEYEVSLSCGTVPSASSAILPFSTTSCPSNLYIPNDPGFTYVPNGVYNVDEDITSDGLIDLVGNATYYAGKSIELLSGFEVEAGAQFLADISNCKGTPSP